MAIEFKELIRNRFENTLTDVFDLESTDESGVKTITDTSKGMFFIEEKDTFHKLSHNFNFYAVMSESDAAKWNDFVSEESPKIDSFSLKTRKDGMRCIAYYVYSREEHKSLLEILKGFDIKNCVIYAEYYNPAFDKQIEH